MRVRVRVRVRPRVRVRARVKVKVRMRSGFVARVRARARARARVGVPSATAHRTDQRAVCVIDERQRDHVVVHVAYPRLAAHAAFGRPHAQPLLRHLELEQLRRRVGIRLRLWCHGTPEAGTVAPRPGQAALSLRRTARRRLVRIARTYYTEAPSTCQHRPLPACLPLHARSLRTMPSQAPDRRLPWPGAARRADGRPRGRRAAGTHCRSPPSRPLPPYA